MPYDFDFRSERERGRVIVKEISDRIGKPPLTYDDRGEVYVHPELARELDKPENTNVRELIAIGIKTIGYGPPADVAKKSEIVNFVAHVLRIQIAMAGDASMDDENGKPKCRAMGYVCGLVDAALKSIDQPTADLSAVVPITLQVLRKLWPERADAYMDFFKSNIGDSKLMKLGFEHGFQQWIDYSEPSTPSLPLGLVRFIIDGERPRSSGLLFAADTLDHAELVNQR
jgi:hypothetical protein